MAHARFRSISGRVLALALLPVGLFLLFFAFYVRPTLREGVLSAKQDGIPHELASPVHETAKTSDELARVAEGLRAVVEGFKL